MKTSSALSITFALCSLAACGPKAEAPQAAAKSSEPAAPAKAEAAPINTEAQPGRTAKVEGIPEGEHDPGCLHESDSCDHNEPPAAGAAGHFGDVFSVDAAQPLSAAIASFDPASEQPVLVSGEVKSVCQAKGCWMVIEQGDLQARVLMKDHKFAVPMDGKGAAARVQGVLTEKTLSEAQVKHIEKDAGRDPESVKGERKEYILTATGVELTRS